MPPYLRTRCINTFAWPRRKAGNVTPRSVSAPACFSCSCSLDKPTRRLSVPPLRDPCVLRLLVLFSLSRSVSFPVSSQTVLADEFVTSVDPSSSVVANSIHHPIARSRSSGTYLWFYSIFFLTELTRVLYVYVTEGRVCGMMLGGSGSETGSVEAADGWDGEGEKVSALRSRCA